MPPSSAGGARRSRSSCAGGRAPAPATSRASSASARSRSSPESVGISARSSVIRAKRRSSSRLHVPHRDVLVEDLAEPGEADDRLLHALDRDAHDEVRRAGVGAASVVDRAYVAAEAARLAERGLRLRRQVVDAKRQLRLVELGARSQARSPPCRRRGGRALPAPWPCGRARPPTAGARRSSVTTGRCRPPRRSPRRPQPLPVARAPTQGAAGARACRRWRRRPGRSASSRTRWRSSGGAAGAVARSSATSPANSPSIAFTSCEDIVPHFLFELAERAAQPGRAGRRR